MERLPVAQMKFLRILIVDDDSFSLRIIRHILYGLGIGKIEEAFNGEEAIRILEKNEFDILITDIEMPKMNGLELVKRIRCGQTHSARTLATIVVTNLSETELLGSILALDVNGFLSKPIKQIWVHEKITEALTEGGYIQPVASYESVETSLPGLRKKNRERTKTEAGENKQKSEKKPTANTPSEEMVIIRDLKPGMRISNDIRLKDGTLLLSSGYKLTEATINRLHDLRDTLGQEMVSILQEKAPA